MNRVLAIILGGGAGTRLQPLTLTRAKPAVPLGGKYRLIDIPISNCINCPASTPLADSRQPSWPVRAPRLSPATTWGRRHEK